MTDDDALRYYPQHRREQLLAEREELSLAADRLTFALLERDVPVVLVELPRLQSVIMRYVQELHAGITKALRAAVSEVPVAFRLELIDAVLADCRTRDRRDPLLFSAQHSLYFLADGLEPAELSPVAEQWFAFVARHDTYVVWESVVPLVREYRDRGGALEPTLVGAIRRTAAPDFADYQGTGGLRALVATFTEPPVNPGEAWSDRVLADLEQTPAAGADPGPWRQVIALAAGAAGPKPSKAWEKSARALAAQIGPEATRDRLLEWLAVVGKPRTIPMLHPAWHDTDTNADQYDPCNIDVLRGLVWLLGFTPPGADTARTLGRITETSLRKLPGIGQRCVRAANAAVYALSRQESDAALAELARLSIAVTYKGTLKEITKALSARAAALGLSTDEVEELSVPSHGLTEPGRRLVRFGQAEAELTVVGTSVVWSWRAAGGKAVKSAPAKVRAEYGAELKELRADAADIAKTLAAHSERLDRQFLARRSWRYGEWRARLADHPLLSTLVRRLIWLVDGTAVFFDGIGANDALRAVDGVAVTPDAQSLVELWHPVGQELAEVMAWRTRLEDSGVRQPFKQAHREVYPLTPAEETTAVYSNRFAAHLLRQHQFQALATARGWHSKLRLAVDDSFPPAVKQLPLWDLRAEFWVDGAESQDPDDYQIADSGAYLYLSTDQVRFYRHGAPANSAHAGSGAYATGYGQMPAEPVPLAEIPPLVLSEVLRDVDLFVGVSSVGNDPTWSDGGPAGRHREYWRDYAFGELGVSGRDRADLLARRVPRLAVADRCRIEGRFLEVRGRLNTYKIHLGSGNILMEPGDRYLCIVPGRGVGEAADPHVSLPFEGDRTLALILSKAILLADDAAITDPTIVRQLRR